MNLAVFPRISMPPSPPYCLTPLYTIMCMTLKRNKRIQDLILYLLENKTFAKTQIHTHDSLQIPLDDWNHATGMNCMSNTKDVSNNNSCHLLDDMDFMAEDGCIELIVEHEKWYVSLSPL